MTSVAVGSVRALCAAVADARERRVSLRIAGSGTWLDAGRPVRATETLSTRELSGIVEYVPGDLTLTALAGTTLGEIRAATAEHRQWLALDPHGSDDGTIGAALATASAGPLATMFGRPRDLALGLEFVTGTGAAARGGGRVVKNVAGFDLTRLLTGSWGTLGIITEVAVRLHARPRCDETIAVPLDANDGVRRIHQLLRRLPFVPYACEVLNTALARQLTGSAVVTALIRLGGNAEAVGAQRAAFGDLGSAQPVDASVWTQLRNIESPRSMVFRLSQMGSKIHETWAEAMRVEAACPGTFVHASPALGIVRCIVPYENENEARLRELFRTPVSSAVTRVGERLPDGLWPVCAPAPTADELSMRIKRAFDPDAVLNPGIFGEVT